MKKPTHLLHSHQNPTNYSLHSPSNSEHDQRASPPTMEEPTKTLIEQRDEVMISPTGSDPFRRTAHFLKPTSAAKIPKLPSPLLHSKTQKPPLEVSFLGWRFPPRNWVRWVDRMASLHEPTWQKAGIADSILSSKCRIRRNDDLVSGLANFWCPETKSFVFSWGEATITLEDVFVLGGYSVVGDPVFPQLGRLDLEEIEEKLNQARLEIVRTKSKKASQGLWMKRFMDSGSELEHEAFLSLWLSRFVLNLSRDAISRHVLSIAVLLARGTRIALGPAVLAAIYRDLSLWKEKIVALNELEVVEDGVFELTLWSPLQLVQVWVFERFLDFSPKPNPNPIQCGKPRMARWDDMRSSKVDDVMLALNSARERFLWRPYGRNVENLRLPKFYVEEDMWVCVDGDLDVELESFGRFLQVGEIVGIDCVQQYLPHRVAMQFGVDQDLPGLVARSNESETPEVAWKGYCEKINNVRFLIPSRHFEADVSSRYLKWWKRSVSRWPQRNGSVMRCQAKTAKRKEDEVTLAAWLSHDREKLYIDEDNLPIAELLSRDDKSCDRGKRCIEECDLPIAAWLNLDNKSGDREKRCLDKEDDLPIATLLKCRKKFKKRSVVELLRLSDESNHSSRNSWTQSPCMEDNTDSAQKATHCNAESGGSQKESIDSGVDAVMKAEEGNGNDDGGEGRVLDEAEMIALRLEARVSRLEKLMANLKEAKKIREELKKEAAVIWLE